MILAMCSDTNPKIRIDAAEFFNQYFKERAGEIVGSPWFKELYLSEVIELVGDEELTIRLEAIEAVTHVLERVKNQKVEKELMPAVLKLLEKVDYVEITRKVSSFFGQLVYKLSL